MPLIYNPNVKLSIGQQRSRLPIARCRRELLYLLECHDVVVVVGETGCGKSTQLPQFLYEAGWCAGGRMVGVTEPRRVAASSLAERVAKEVGCVLGTTVGYSIRFDRCFNEDLTKIKFMTDGVLMQEVMLDPYLSKYSVIMVDEAHERHLETDIILGLLKKIQKKRNGFRIIVSSATLEAEEMKEFYNQRVNGKDTCAIASIEGRVHPVDILYSIEPVADYVYAAYDTILNIHRTEPEGDVLVFLTGQSEIEELVRLLHDVEIPHGADALTAVPLHANLNAAEQKLAFQRAPRNCRKIVVSTNVAEASITIDGIMYVIDCGFVKLRTYDPRNGADALVVTSVSKASAIQRAGRAGRVAPGKCFRLYTEEGFDNMEQQTVPEMQRTCLDGIIIQLKALGIDNVLRFSFLSPPPVESLIRSLELLYALGLLNDEAHLTRRGRRVASLPLPPSLGTALVRSRSFGVQPHVLSIMAMLSVDSPFPTIAGGQRDAKGFAVYEGDHLSLLNCYNAYIAAKNPQSWCQRRGVKAGSLRRAAAVRKQLSESLRSALASETVDPDGDNDDVDWSEPEVESEPYDAMAGSDVNTTQSSTTTMTRKEKEKEARIEANKLSARVRKAIASGVFGNAACRAGADGSYRTVRGKERLYIHPQSVLYQRPPQWLVYHDILYTQKQYMRDVSVVEPTWLTEIAPHFYQFKTTVEVERERGKGAGSLLLKKGM